MSQERDLDQTVTVSRGDVTVEKSFEPDEFPVPAVTFQITSTGSEPIEVRLVDQIPEEFPMSAIGFHPEFESDNWSAYKDHRVVFERTLEPEEEIQTVYGVRLDREEDAVAFLGEPILEGIDDADENVEDILGEDRNQAVRDVLAGERDTLVDEPADEDGSDADDSQDAPEIELEDPTEGAGSDDADVPSPRSIAEGTAAVTELDSDTEVGAQPSAESDTEEGVEAADPAEGDGAAVAVSADGDSRGVAGALAAEIRAGDVADEDLELLRDELDLGVPRSVDVRIQRLQRTVSDLNAYTEALEEFIDEEGTAEELIDSFRADVETLSQTVEEDIEAVRADIEEDVQDVRADVEGVTADLETVDDEVDRVTEEIDHVTDEVSDVSTDLETLRTDLDREVDSLEQQLDATTDDLESTLEDELDTIRTEIDRTADDILTETEANSDKLASLEAEFREFEEFRDRLEQAFGGMGGVSESDDED